MLNLNRVFERDLFEGSLEVRPRQLMVGSIGNKTVSVNLISKFAAAYLSKRFTHVRLYPCPHC